MATKGFPTLSYLNLSSFVGKTLNLKAFLYPPRWLGVGINSPSVSVQATLDGRILTVEEFETAVDEMSRIPCDKRCLLALEDECRCRCGGANHGLWIKGATNNARLEAFDGESGPVMSRDIAKGKLELMLRARQEVVAAYSALFGGLQK
jgi:hypothetical protein